MNDRWSSNSQSAIRLLYFFLASISTISTSNATTKTINVPSSEVGGLQRAFDDILTLPGEYQNIRIFLENGTHRIANTIVVNSTHTANVDHIFVEAENATLSGGVVVSSKWEKVKVINKAVVWKANLPQSADLSISSRLQAWRGKKRLQVARSPLYLYTNVSTTSLYYAPGQVLEKYYDQENVLVLLYESWTASLHRIASINASTNTLTFQTSFNAQWANQASGRRYYIMNAKELLDTVDEFYIDVSERAIYIVTDASDDPNLDDKDPVTVAQHLEIVNVQGEGINSLTKNIRFEGVAFAHTAVETDNCLSTSCDGQSASFLTTAMFRTRFVSNVSLHNCHFMHTGGYAVWFDRGSVGSTLSNSVLMDLGSGSARIGEAVQNKYIATGNVVMNNVMRDGGNIYQMGCGVLCQNSKDTLITHNEISYFKYTGISTGWTWGFGTTPVSNITTSFNHIHHIGLGYLSDMGCVYTLGHQPMSSITNNLCHDVQSYNYGGWGYYTDEGSRDETFSNNIALRTKCAGHHQHYGTDNILENNIYFDVNIGDVPTPGREKVLMENCDTSIRSSQHNRNVNTCHPNISPTTGCCCHPGCRDQGKCSSFIFRKNIVYQPSKYNSSFVGATVPFGLDNFTFENNLYWIAGDEATSLGLLWNTTASHHWVQGSDFSTWSSGTSRKDRGSIVADPQLNTSNFRFAKTSPALTKIGFEPINISKIGPMPNSLYMQELVGKDVLELLARHGAIAQSEMT